MKRTAKRKRPNKTQVPRQLLGYGLQYSRMVAFLLESAHQSVVSLEYFEDVGVDTGDSKLASQTKSSLAKNPVGDRATPFWKTIKTWLNAIKSGQLVLSDTVFELYVFGEYEGSICSSFSKATTVTEAKAAIKNAKKRLTKGGKKLPAHVAAVLNSNQDILAHLLTKFRYSHGSGESIKDLTEQFAKALVPPEFLNNVLVHAIGWIKKEVDQLLEKNGTAAVSVGAFRDEITAFVRALAFSACLSDLAGPATPAEIATNRSRRYVRQLELIEVPDERKLRAISAFLRSSVNRAEWGRLGIVHERNLDDFEARLIDYWRNSRAQCDIALTSLQTVQRGQYLLSECMKCNLPLQGKPVPHDFVEGCYHALADGLGVGWHPHFEKLTADWK